MKGIAEEHSMMRLSRETLVILFSKASILWMDIQCHNDNS